MPVPWTFADVKRHAIGVILIASLFLALLALDPHKWTNDASPIRSVEPIGATVKSAHWGKGQSVYMLFEDGSSVFIDDDRPHLIGARVAIERVTRDNGFVFYGFPE
ncbi:MAG: hypothetical protein E5V28_05160 [Mesorhizobium sp.]|nr:MAG: hypothetical protein E5V19_02870 [Mesorhizobium sp.]TIX59734.1 MAG: hypothetical protein E5V28_05160 [Mesorhizobium sp.]